MLLLMLDISNAGGNNLRLDFGREFEAWWRFTCLGRGFGGRGGSLGGDVHEVESCHETVVVEGRHLRAGSVTKW